MIVVGPFHNLPKLDSKFIYVGNITVNINTV